eukprot:130700-Rhodomonas_salina.1
MRTSWATTLAGVPLLWELHKAGAVVAARPIAVAVALRVGLISSARIPNARFIIPGDSTSALTTKRPKPSSQSPSRSSER